MISKINITILATLIFLLSLDAFSVERFPPPDFESGYQSPVTTQPPPRAPMIQYLDIAVLVFALSLASWLALAKRSRRGLFWLMVGSLLYFGFWRKGCVCPIGAIQNVTLALFDHTYAIPLVVIIFFTLPLVFTLFFGRGFCAAVCPLGAIQDAVLVKPISLPAWLEQVLGLLGYIYLGAAIVFAATGSAFIICEYDPFVGFFRFSASFEMIVLGGCFLVIGMFLGRPYCRFFCPYGVILRNLARFSKRRITITPDICVQCRLCEESCPFGAIQPPVEAPPIREYTSGKKRFLILLLVAPVILTAAGLAGGYLHKPFARMHATVRLADRIYQEENHLVKDTTDASEAFRATGKPIAELYQEATAIKKRFKAACTWLGIFIGLVIIAKLIILTTRRTRREYEADRGRCLSCGRCYDYCPIGKAQG